MRDVYGLKLKGQLNLPGGDWEPVIWAMQRYESVSMVLDTDQRIGTLFRRCANESTFGGFVSWPCRE